jgi:phosphoesterase RecJ-like protein
VVLRGVYMDNLYEAKERILEAKEMIIGCHLNPDGDSIGSMLALGLGVARLGKKAYMVSPNGVPKIYRALPGADRVAKKADKPADLAIAVDCGDKERLGRAYGIFEKAKDIIVIDHHEFGETFGNINVIDARASSAGELVYRILRTLPIRITSDMAQNLLTAIIVETNSFRLPNVRPSTFEICAQLAKTGVDFHKLSELVYWSRRRQAALLSGLCVSRAEFSSGGRISWSVARKRDFKKFGAETEDADSVAADMLSVKGVEIAAFFREEKGKLRVSIRSKGNVNIAKVARDYGGGGHFDAAGCYIANRDRAIKKLLSDLKKVLKGTR